MKLKSFILICFSLFFSTCYISLFPSVVEGVLVKTINGFVFVEDLHVGDTVIGFNTHGDLVETSVTKIEKKEVGTIVAIELNAGGICACKDQIFYDPVLRKWIKAKDLTSENVLLDSHCQHHHCISVECIDYKTTAYQVSLRSPHTFFISEYEILTHNFSFNANNPIIFRMKEAFRGGARWFFNNSNKTQVAAKVGVFAGFGARSLWQNSSHTNNNMSAPPHRTNQNVRHCPRCCPLGRSVSTGREMPPPPQSNSSKSSKTRKFSRGKSAKKKPSKKSVSKKSFVESAVKIPVESTAKMTKAIDVFNSGDRTAAISSAIDSRYQQVEKQKTQRNQAIHNFFSQNKQKLKICEEKKQTGFFGTLFNAAKLFKQIVDQYEDIVKIKDLVESFIGDTDSNAESSEKSVNSQRLVSTTKQNVQIYNKDRASSFDKRHDDSSWAIFDHVQAIGEGVYEGGKHSLSLVTDIICHPIKNVQNIFDLAKKSTVSLTKASLELISLNILLDIDPKAANEKLETWRKGFSFSTDTFCNSIKSMPGREITKTVSKTITEGVLFHKGFGLVKTLARASKVQGLRLAQKIKRAQKSSIVATTPEGILVRMDGAKQIAKGVSGEVAKQGKKKVAKSLKSNTIKPLGRGSTGRTVPKNLAEKLAMEEVMSNPHRGAKILRGVHMTDPRWHKSDGWVKMARNVENVNLKGDNVEVHYVWNKILNLFDDFKFKY